MSQEVPLSALEATLRDAGELICRLGHDASVLDTRGARVDEADVCGGFFIAGAVAELTGHSPSTIGSLADLVDILHVDDRARFEHWCGSDRGPIRRQRILVRICRPDGQELRCEADIASDGIGGSGRVLILRAVPTRARIPVTSTSNRVHRRVAAPRLLLADDSLQTVSALETLLTRRGYRVRVATDGLAALQLAHEFEPHAAVLDIDMPGATGLEVATALRRWFGSRPLLLIALSGHSRRDVRVRAAEAGFDHHLQKPANIASIIALLAKA